MHLIALTRWNANASLEQELKPLAAALGLGLHDLRMKLVSPTPTVLISSLSAQAAQPVLALLHARGHGAVAVPSGNLLAPEQMRVARSVSLSDHALEGVDAQGQPFAVAFAALSATLRASEQSDQSETVAAKSKKLALGRALLTGGLMRNKTVTTLETTETSERQAIAYVFHGAPEPLVLKAQHLNYEGMGAVRALTAQASFDKLVAHLRSQAPGGLHDDRLLTQKRKLELSAVRASGPQRVISNSNAAANALAAQLIVFAHRLGQL